MTDDLPARLHSEGEYPGSERGWKPADLPRPFFVRHADVLYQACDEAIRAGRVDARSKIGDAALDYRDERDEMANQRPGSGAASAGRDMQPLAERPGYNAKPTDWVRYANYLEADLPARLHCAEMAAQAACERAERAQERIRELEAELAESLRTTAEWVEAWAAEAGGST